MKAAVIRPFHWHPDFYTLELPVRDGAVQRDTSQAVTKFAIVDRFSGEGRVSKMFWRGCGPRTPDTALACSVAHDKHNIWVVGSSDARFYAAGAAIPTIILGPGTMDEAHVSDESVDVDLVEKSVDLYANLAAALLAPASD